MVVFSAAFATTVLEVLHKNVLVIKYSISVSDSIIVYKILKQEMHKI